MNFAAAVLLGIVQGLTEFLPVSSSAHLILARAFFGWEVPADFGLAFDVALHIGTLAAIVAFFHARDRSDGRGAFRRCSRRTPDASARLAQRIVVGTVPVVVVGLLFNDFIEEALRTPAVAAGALALGAVGDVRGRAARRARRAKSSVTWIDAVLIGCAQAVRADPRRVALGRRRSASGCSSACGVTRRRGSRSCWPFPRRSRRPARSRSSSGTWALRPPMPS